MEKNKIKQNIKLKKIKLFISDVDGVFTDGAFYISGELKEFKKFNALDGLGVKILQTAGIPVVVISGRHSDSTTDRMTKLGIENIFQGEIGKLDAYEKMKQKFAVEDEEIAYIGDDVVDIPLLKKVGFAATVPNSIEEVQKVAHYVTEREGGCGAFREVADMLLKAQDKFYTAIEKFIGINIQE